MMKVTSKVMVGLAFLFLAGCENKPLDYANKYSGCLYLVKAENVYHIVAEVYYSDGFDVTFTSFPSVTIEDDNVTATLTSDAINKCADKRFPNVYKRINAISIGETSPEEIIKDIESQVLIMKVTDYYNDVETSFKPLLEPLGYFSE